MEQGTTEWLRARAGKVTASRVADLIAKTKSGWGASRANYMAELIAERLTGAPAEKFQSAAMAWGSDTEEEARASYEFSVGAVVETVGFIPHPSIDRSGASPDGLVNDNGLVEIKCPNTATHLDTLLGRTVPGKYVTQIQWQLACTGREWCDFVSYDPRLPEHIRLFVQRVPRDGATIRQLEDDVRAFLAEMDEKLSALDRLYARQEAA